VPLRFGTLCSEDTQTLQRLTPFYSARSPAELYSGQAPELEREDEDKKNVAYAIRIMRSGYVYLFAKREFFESAGENQIQTQEKWVVEGCVRTNVNFPGMFEKERPAQTVDNQETFSVAPGGMHITIREPGGIQELRVLYTPDKLTHKRLEDILQNNPAGEASGDEQSGLRDMLQEINVQSLVDVMQQGQSQKDIIAPREFNELVTEFIATKEIKNETWARYRPHHGHVASSIEVVARNNPQIGLLSQQLFAYPSARMRPAPLNVQGSLYALEEKFTVGQDQYTRGVGLVLGDPIGITQELNNWRNAAYEKIHSDFLNKNTTVSGRTVTYERAVRAAAGYDNLHQSYGLFKASGHIEQQWSGLNKSDQRYVIAQGIKASYERSLERYKNMSDEAYQREIEHSDDYMVVRDRQERIKNLEEDIAREEARIRRLEGELALAQGEFAQIIEHEAQQVPLYQQEFEEKYTPMLNSTQYDTIRQAYQQACKRVDGIVDKRVQNHLGWLQSTVLLNALDYYDPGDAMNGVAFTEQAMFCMQNAEGNEDGYQQVIEYWWMMREADLRKNLALRAFCFNQEALYPMVSSLMEKAGDLERGISETYAQEQWDTLTEQQVQSTAGFSDYAKILNEVSGQFGKIVQDAQGAGMLSSLSPKLGGAYGSFQQLLTRLMATGGVRSIDWGLYRFYRDLACAGLLKNATLEEIGRNNIRSGLFNTPSSRSEFTKVAGASQDSLVQLRCAGVLMAAEALNLIALLFKGSKTAEDYYNLYGAVMSTTSTLFMYGAVCVEQAWVHAQWSGFRALGTFIGALGALPLALRDIYTSYHKMREAYESEHFLLASVYGLRVSIGVYTSVTIVASVVEQIANITFRRTLLAGGELTSAQLATPMGRALTLARAASLSNPVGIAIFLITIAVGALITYQERNLRVRPGVWLSRFILRSADTTVLEHDSVTDDHGVTIEVPLRMYASMQDEQKEFAAVLRYLTNNVPTTLISAQTGSEGAGQQIPAQAAGGTP